MNIKSKRIFAVSTIIVLSGFLLNPALAEDVVTTTAVETTTEVVTTEVVVTDVVTTSVPTTGTINIQNIVVNDNLGTKTAADFEFTVKHFGTNVEGSPFSVTETSQTHFVLEPGTYVVAVSSVDGYLGTWSGEGIENGFVDLKAGQEITFIRNTYDVGMAAVVAPVAVPTSEPVTEPTTEDGGTLPATGSNWFNLLALGFLLSAAGAYSFRKNSVKI